VTKLPLIVHLDAPFPVEREFYRTGHFARLHCRCLRALGEAARLVVTVSTASRDYYEGMGIPREKILVLPNGISSRLLEQGAKLARARLPLADPGICTVGFVGSLSRWHRVDLLIEALRELNTVEERANWRMQIVGYGEEYENLRRRSRELGLESQMGWLGPLSHERAFEQIAQFDIAVLPHTLPTGAPMKLFEYAAVARPTIAPDLPNLRELFTDKEMCFVKPGNPKVLTEAMLWLAQHPEEAIQLGQRAQARVRQYTWEEIVARLLQSLASAYR
jgi:glycosyltransferase involved in cell wall biosynthesis